MNYPVYLLRISIRHGITVIFINIYIMLVATICEMAQTHHSLWVVQLCIVIDI